VQGPKSRGAKKSKVHQNGAVLELQEYVDYMVRLHFVFNELALRDFVFECRLSGLAAQRLAVRAHRRVTVNGAMEKVLQNGPAKKRRFLAKSQSGRRGAPDSH
jgi:hypothetical protein